VERLLEQAPGFEMRLAPRRHVDDFARPGIARCGFRPRILDLEHAKAPYFYAISLNETVAHSYEEAIHHLGGQILLATRASTDEEGQILFGYSSQERTS